MSAVALIASAIRGPGAEGSDTEGLPTGMHRLLGATRSAAT